MDKQRSVERWIEWIKFEASYRYGLELPTDIAGYILWNDTPYPQGARVDVAAGVDQVLHTMAHTFPSTWAVVDRGMNVS